MKRHVRLKGRWINNRKELIEEKKSQETEGNQTFSQSSG